MERKIGEIFNVHGTFLQVWEAKESDGCNGCFFEEYRPLCLPYICAAQEREDGKNVQFKEISKTITTEETLNKYIKVKTTGTPTLHRHSQYDWAFKTVLGTAKKK